MGTLALVILLAASASCRRPSLADARGGGPGPGTVDGGGAAGAGGPRDGAADLLGRDAAAGSDAGHPADGPPADTRPSDAPTATDASLDGGDARDAASDTGSARDAATDAGDAHDAAPDSGGAGDAATDGGGPKPRVLVRVLSGAPWYATQATQGMAVDAAKRVYIGDYANVFVVDGTSVTTYLTASEAAGPGGSSASLGDLDIGPDGRLYLVMSAFFTGKGQVQGVLRSSMAHQADPWVDLTKLVEPQKLSVIGDGYAALVSREGFWTFTDAGGQLVYDMTEVGGTQSCATEDLSAARSGVFLYQPGCNVYPLMRGNADGTGVGVLYTAAFMQPSPIGVSNFVCSARDPAGGFYFVARDSNDSGPLLFHVAEDASGTSGLDPIPTVPTFKQAEATNGETFGFWYGSLAVAQDGTVFFQTYHQLWEVLPP
jgi:hypothetical protein